LITTQSAGFVFGMLLSHIRTNGGSWANFSVLVFAMLVMVPGIEEYGRDLASVGYQLSMNHGVNFLFPVFMFALLAACIYLPDIPLPKAVAVYLGGISYPLYIVHQEVGYALFENRPGIFPDVIWIAISMAIVLLLASLVYRLEIPTRKYMTGVVDRLENRLGGSVPAQ
jgi:peptidoglycan/LPS O-acetylase OafA/YrhL